MQTTVTETWLTGLLLVVFCNMSFLDDMGWLPLWGTMLLNRIVSFGTQVESATHDFVIALTDTRKIS